MCVKEKNEPLYSGKLAVCAVARAMDFCYNKKWRQALLTNE